MKKLPKKEEYQALRSFLKLTSEHSSRAELVRCAIEEELTPRQQELVRLYYVRQLPMQYIAAELGINVSTVSRTLARAKVRLERCLKYGGRNFTYLLEDE